MNKFKMMYGLLLFMLFVSRVDALSYNISTKVNSLANNIYEIRVSLTDINDTDYGLSACMFNVDFTGGVSLNGNIRTVETWSITSGGSYLVDTVSPKMGVSEMMIIPVKLSSNGRVLLNNIRCSDDEEEISISNKEINLTYKKEVVNNNPDKNVNVENSYGKSSNCDLSNIELSEGKIDFESSILEYSLEVSDYSKLKVKPVLADNTAKYQIDRSDDSVLINVTAEDGTVKTYVLYVSEIKEELKKESSKKYIPIFIGIICILVVINILRVTKKFIKK